MPCRRPGRTSLDLPRDEHAIDVFHKAVYAFSTGAIADALAADPPAWIAARR